MKVKVYYSAVAYVDIPNDYKELDANNQCWDYDDRIEELADEVALQLPPNVTEIQAITAYADSKVLYEMF